MGEPAAATRKETPRPLELDRTNFDEVGATWDHLASASGNIFATREWLRTWFEHYGDGDPIVIACHIDGRTVAILPLEVRRIAGARVLRFLGHGPSDQMGPVCHPADAAAAATALRAVLGQPPRRYDVFVGRHLPEPHDWPALLDARTVVKEASPVMPFDGATWDDILASFGSGIRKEIRYDTRRLAREHEVGYRLYNDKAALPKGLEVLFDLHLAQWGNSSPFTRSEAFHRSFAALALEREWLRLWGLEVDGRSVAAKLNFRFGEAEFSYQGGRDPGWHGSSLGLVNLAHAMRTSFEEGAREYRFLLGGERYKFRFPVQGTSVQTVVSARRPTVRIALAAGLRLERFQAARNLRRSLRRHLSG